MTAYVASEDKILVQMDDNRIIVFDSDGYICDDDMPELLWQSEQSVIKYSPMTQEFGRFFLMKDAYNSVRAQEKMRYSLI